MGAAGQVAPEWIVCMGALRDVLHDRVACPVRARAVPFTSCMACRRLESRSDDRALGPCCLLDDGQPSASGALTTGRV